VKVDIVTGGCGLSGTYLVKHLVEQGRKVRATDLESSYDSPKAQDLRRAVDLDFERDGVEWVPSDLTNKRTLPKLFKGDVGGAEPATLIVGVVTSFVSGILAISLLLRYLRTRSFNIFVAYRLVLAAIIVVAFLAR